MTTLTPSIEDYLKAILILEGREGAAKPADIAKVVRVGRPSVSLALRRLKGKGLVSHDAYGDATLTPEGRKAAKSVLLRHEALSRFFTDVLGIPKDQAEANAHRLEHSIDDTVLERLVIFTGTLNQHPGTSKEPLCPCNNESLHYGTSSGRCFCPHEEPNQESLV